MNIVSDKLDHSGPEELSSDMVNRFRDAQVSSQAVISGVWGSVIAYAIR